MNILDKIIHYPLSIIHFYRWHPEVAIRYLPIVKQLRAISHAPRAILEVGSGWLGISPYLGRQITGLDEDFENKSFPLLKQIKENVLKIPFGNNSFDIIICVDVLEHLPKNKRQIAVNELLRVGKNYVFLGVPCGKKSFKQDLLLDKHYKKIFNKPFPFLQEHLKYGLPEEKQITQLIKEAAKINKKDINIRITGNESLKLRKFLMTGFITKNSLIDFIYRKAMLFGIPFFSLFDRPPYYRKLFFVRIK